MFAVDNSPYLDLGKGIYHTDKHSITHCQRTDASAVHVHLQHQEADRARIEGQSTRLKTAEDYRAWSYEVSNEYLLPL